MKTIERAASIYAEPIASDLSHKSMDDLNICDLEDYIAESFKEGVEFAQRWISVEEELPPIGEMVLTKMEKRHGDTWVQHYYSTATRLENQGEWQDVNWVDHSMSFGHITHWRPIELK